MAKKYFIVETLHAFNLLWRLLPFIVLWVQTLQPTPVTWEAAHPLTYQKFFITHRIPLFKVATLLKNKVITAIIFILFPNADCAVDADLPYLPLTWTIHNTWMNPTLACTVVYCESAPQTQRHCAELRQMCFSRQPGVIPKGKTGFLSFSATSTRLLPLL